MDINSPIEENFRLTPRQKTALKKLGLAAAKDLLFYFPFRYESFSERKNIIDLAEGDRTTVFGTIIKTKTEKTWRRKINLSEITISDLTGAIKATWFNQPYVAKTLKDGDKVALTGKITRGKSGLYIANPNYEKVNSYEALGEGSAILAIYPESAGVTSRWLRFAVKKTLRALKTWPDDPLPEEILKRYNLPSLKSSLIFIHEPRKISDTEAARKRFAFEEIFLIQIARLKQRTERDKKHPPIIKINAAELDNFISTFPFELTGAQKKAVDDVAQDLRKNKPMSRLLEGDVGSGKTAVAVAAAYMAVSGGYQVAYMAPTEILASQHFNSFIDYFSKLRLTAKIGLITSSECKKFPSKVSIDQPTHISKPQLLKWVAGGEISILIGTHSLIQESVKFSAKGGSPPDGRAGASSGKGLALVVIDEQHRFGARQRAALIGDKANASPHLLSMTATPIPRTLALTIYGDLDLSLLDEIPKGRQKIITNIVSPSGRGEAYESMRKEIQDGRQAYVICPRIQEPASSADKPDSDKLNALNVKAVKEESKRLKKEVFPEFEMGALHGKLLPKEKEKVLNDFRDNKIKILVATSVVEVGIDVPNATVILIEGADRFGLAQLHQLRGRVMRSVFQPYCFVFTDSRSAKTKERLKAFVSAKNGFELAEYDLQLRGAGELSGGRQWGISDIGMEALKNIKMVEAARVESQKIIKQDPDLKNYPLILERVKHSKYSGDSWN